MFRSLLKYCFLAALLLIIQSSFAQKYGNEWITPGQRYFKIPVSKTGFYLLTYNDLANAGFPLNSADSRKIQLFHRGKEQSIYLSGEADGHFDSNDSLVFYGIRNNGELDSLLYDPYTSQPHKYYNIYSDTTAYFLTVSASADGKRMPQLNNPSSGTPESYHLQEILNVYADEYEHGLIYSVETVRSSWDIGEGWTGVVYDNVSKEIGKYQFDLSNYVSSGPLPKLEILFCGRNDLGHSIKVTVGDPVSGSVYTVNNFSGRSVKYFSADVNPSLISGNQLKISVQVIGSGQADAASVSYMKLTYPQQLNMGGRAEANLNLLPNASSISVSGIFSIPTTPVIYDITDRNEVKIIKSSIAAGSLVAGITSSSSDLFVTSAASYNKPSSVSEVDLNIYPVSAKYVIITHPGLMSSASEYAAYRQSPEGGGYTTLITDIQKLYNLFSYGEKSSSAVRKFFNYYIDKGNPEHALIIGKGLEPGHVSDGQNYRQHPEATWNASLSEERADDLVPVGGTPGSDWIYVMGLGGKGKYIPAIPLGRIPARNNDQVKAYLEKVKEHEDPSRNPNALWRKRLVHLSGGNTQDQIKTFKGYLVGFKSIAEGPFFGGRVKSFVKNTTSPTEFINLSAEVNAGVSVITFFGHSSPQYSDVDIGIVTGNTYGYDNKGKYPLILMNGCASSNIYTGYSFAENWILTANKGAILFVGHTDAGYPLELKPYSEQIYKRMFTDTLGMHRPFGQIQRDAIEAYMGGAFGEPAYANAEQMILVGDPALRVYAPGFKEHGKSTNDYAINSSGLFLKSFGSDRVSAISDSFSIGIPISNFGITNKNKFSVCLKRTIGTKVINYSPVFFDPVSFEDTIYYTVRSKDPETYGLNDFEITLDCENAIVEADDFINNKASLDFFMPLSSVACLYPSEFSIVHKQPVTFIAQTTDLLEAEADYHIELDTSWKFNSAFKKSVTIHSGSLIKWENVKLLDTIPSNDSTVYYWRVRKSGNEDDELWTYSSFIYIHNSPEGWSQSEYPQFFKDEPVDAKIDSLNGTLKFSENKTHIYIHNAGPKFSYPVNTEYPELSDKQFVQTIVRTNGALWIGNGRGACQTDPDVGSIFGFAFDKISGKMYLPTQEVPLCGVAGKVISNLVNEFYYPKYISQVKDGDYILLMTHGRVNFDSWSADAKDLFKNKLKAKLIDSLKSDYAYIILTKIGLDKPIYEKYSEDMIDLDTTLSGYNYKGGITSTLIGPSNEWGTLFHTVKTSQNDQYELKVIRYNLKNVADTISIPQKDSLDLSALINANTYPYIKLYAELMDSVNLTPPDLSKWQVIYSPVPEGTITPVAWKLEKSRTVEKQEGEPYNLNFEFTNITNRPFTDSLKVKYTLKNGSGKIDTSLVNIGKLGPLGTIQFSHEIKSAGFSGKNYFQTYVNPRLQKEQYYNNNFLELEINVTGDKTNPLLDVLFDGVHIMDGDLVSPNPVINVMINDENKYLLKTDSVGISIFLQRPGKNPEQIYFTNPDIIRWGQTSNSKTNSFSIEYNPKNLPDGTYKLIVQGADASNNKSGINFYEINFTVENASTISHFYPYPNPFSTSTKFVFTLSGSVIPEDLKIQIMTVTGKIVREITKAELGTIRIGNNISDYAWDGRDEFGDKLANGVYLYRVIIKNPGDNFKQRSTAGDKAFKKDFGKLYILR